MLPLINRNPDPDEANVIVALEAYTTAPAAWWYRSAGRGAMQVHDAATAIGYSRIAQMLKVELLFISCW